MIRDPRVVRALSWNVHGFRGRARKRDHDAVMHAVRAVDADIVALQEVDERPRGRGSHPAFVSLRKVFENYSAEARTIRSPDGDYGHVLMSRWAMGDIQLLDLTMSGREPRIAISSRVCAPGGDIRVLAAHLGLSVHERRRQLAIIAAHLESSTSRAAIVLGDFNEWRRKGPATRALCPPFAVAAELASFPSCRPLLALDRIWCRAPLEPVSAGLALKYRHLSDHLAVLAELRFAAVERKL